MNKSLIFSVYQFLIWEEEEKAAYLEDMPVYAEYLTPDDDEITVFSSGIVLFACRSILWHFNVEHEWPDITGKMIYQEIECMVEYMFVVAETSGDYHFQMLGSEARVSGPYDGGWDILRRLARASIDAAKLDMNDCTQLPAKELVKRAGYELLSVKE